MTTTIESANAEGMPERSDTLDDIASDLRHLYHLLDASVEDLVNAPRPPEMVGILDRAIAFTWIARNMAETASKRVEMVS